MASLVHQCRECGDIHCIEIFTSKHKSWFQPTGGKRLLTDPLWQVEAKVNLVESVLQSFIRRSRRSCADKVARMPQRSVVVRACLILLIHWSSSVRSSEITTRDGISVLCPAASVVLKGFECSATYSESDQRSITLLRATLEGDGLGKWR